MEKRVEYILNCASTALGVRASAANATSREVTDFLESPTVRLLQAWANGEGLQFATTASLSDQSIATAVVFTKRAAGPVTAENVASVVLMSKVSSPLETLQLALTELYGPVLLQSGQVACGRAMHTAAPSAAPAAPLQPLCDLLRTRTAYRPPPPRSLFFAPRRSPPRRTPTAPSALPPPLPQQLDAKTASKP
jgi:hypothetical protein